MNEKIEKLENEIAKIKGIFKNFPLLSASRKQRLWSQQEKLENELNELLVENGVELNSWDW